jgi:hypothetical protein
MTATLPKQIQSQLEEAERIEAGMQVAPPSEPTEPSTPSTTPTPTEPVAVTPVSQPPAPQAPSREDDAAYWKQRFQTLDGMYRADVGNLRQQLGSLQGQMETLARQKAAEPPKPAQPLVTPDEVEKFGDDMVSMVRRAAQEVLRDHVKPMLDRLAALEQIAQKVTPQLERVQQVEQQVQRTQADSFYAQITAAVPAWQQINVEPAFVQWLAQHDPIAGKSRQDCLNEAAAVFDAERAVAFFKLFVEQSGWKPAAAAAASARSELERQVAPNRSSASTPQAPAAKTYTAADYAYWTDHRRVHDTEGPKLAQMLAEMEAAVADGRVKW